VKEGVCACLLLFATFFLVLEEKLGKRRGDKALERFECVMIGRAKNSPLSLVNSSPHEVLLLTVIKPFSHIRPGTEKVMNLMK
jgi:hypothetical protein